MDGIGDEAVQLAVVGVQGLVTAAQRGLEGFVRAGECGRGQARGGQPVHRGCGPFGQVGEVAGRFNEAHGPSQNHPQTRCNKARFCLWNSPRITHTLGRMRIGLLQITTSDDKADNLRLASEKIREAADKGATLIVCPEATSQAFDSGRLDTQAEELDGPFATGLRELADELGVTIVAGMFRPADSQGEINRVYNTALITGNGLHEGYDKIHTFDTAQYQESKTVRPGTDLHTFTHEGVTVGVAICFDIRYPEQFKQLAREGAKVIVVPTSWADGENKVEQWNILSRARALDAGVFIMAPDQARPGGSAEAGKNSGPTGVGHSMAVAPDGRILAEGGYEPEVLVVNIDPDEAAKQQESLPLL